MPAFLSRACSSQPLSQDVEGGIYYSGKKALVRGVVARGRWFQIRPGFDSSALIVNAVIGTLIALLVWVTR